MERSALKATTFCTHDELFDFAQLRPMKLAAKSLN